MIIPSGRTMLSGLMSRAIRTRLIIVMQISSESMNSSVRASSSMLGMVIIAAYLPMVRPARGNPTL